MTRRRSLPDAAVVRRLAGMLLVIVVAVGFILILCPDLVFAQGFGASAGAGAKPTPFGLGGSRAPSGIGGIIIAWQTEFYRALVKSVRAAKADGNAAFMLAGLSFAYGVFHAAGPGHGKAVISSYLLADGGTLRRGALLALAAGLVQSLTAIAFVGILAVVLGATAVSMARAMNVVEIAAYGGIALLGAWLAVVKTRGLVRALRGHVHAADCGCGDAHAPDPVLVTEGGWRRAAVAVVSAGARPCSGAVLVLTFALSQGVFATGVLAVFAMGLGTALTVTGIAALAVYGKRLAVRLAGADGRWAILVRGGVEVAAAVLVMLFGLALLLGYMESERLLPG